MALPNNHTFSDCLNRLQDKSGCLRSNSRLLRVWVTFWACDKGKGKGITLNLYSATRRVPQLQRRFCVTDRAGVQPIDHIQSLRPQTLAYDERPYAALVCRLWSPPP